MVTFEAGRLVADRFRLEKPLGRGGMGEVWRAHHVTLDMPCAIKFIIEDADDATQRARFQREARAAAKLRSPYVVQMLDHGVWEDTPYIAMELLEGETLEERLDRVGRLASGQVITLFSDVAQALDKARDLGIVHRDLKPGNLFIVQGGKRDVVKVLDFGIAKLSTPLATQHTATGALVGTPSFMSPEQVHGDRHLDHRSDLWSLAVVIFVSLTGKLPFPQKSLGALLKAIMLGEPRLPSRVAPDLPAAVDRWWSKATALEPGDRYQSADELMAGLEEALVPRAERAAATTAPHGSAAVLSGDTVSLVETMDAPLSSPATVSLETIEAPISSEPTSLPGPAKAEPERGASRMLLFAGVASAAVVFTLFAAGTFSSTDGDTTVTGEPTSTPATASASVAAAPSSTVPAAPPSTTASAVSTATVSAPVPRAPTPPPPPTTAAPKAQPSATWTGPGF